MAMAMRDDMRFDENEKIAKSCEYQINGVLLYGLLKMKTKQHVILVIRSRLKLLKLFLLSPKSQCFMLCMVREL